MTTRKVVARFLEPLAAGEFSRVARSTGRSYQMPVALHFRVTDGEITKLYLYEDSCKVARAYAQ